VDMNGKHNPWEAVVLIPFIDETRLREAIKSHCNERALTREEKSRNCVAPIVGYRHDVAVMDAVPSCNPSLYPDISQCQTSITHRTFQKESFTSFEPRLVDGTNMHAPGFPSLNVLTIDQVEVKPIKINVHGTESKYRTLCLSLPVQELPEIDQLAPELLGRPVFVNWPMMHEASDRFIIGAAERALEFLV
jgi:5'-3' exoribonuclease 1